jgi:hypothetical protein
MSYGYYIAIGLIAALMIALLIVVIFRMLKRKQRTSGDKIEQSIDDNLSINALQKKANFFTKDKKYSHAIIYLFYVFRIFCEKNYSIKNARIIDHNELIKKLSGFSEISIFELGKFLKIYEKARFSKEENTYEDYIKMKSFIEKISSSNL